MRWGSIALGGWGLVMLLSCVPAMARTSHDVHGGNCVAYARDVTGVRLDGNAASWWPHAEGRYERGHRPEIGAILVFKPYGRMHVGHVAVVSRVVGPREVLVDQANWVRGRVTKAISVVDASPLNDWTNVKVQFAGTHGRENPTYGFIYPQTLPVNFGAAVAAAESEKPRSAHADRISAHARHHKDDAAQEAAATDDPTPRHIARRHKHGGDTEAAATADAAPQPVAEHMTHQKQRPAHDEAKANPAAAAAPHLVADAAPAHHKHKAPDARFAYVY